MKKRLPWILLALVVAAVIAGALTIWNKGWWIRRAVKKWHMTVTPVSKDSNDKSVNADPSAQPSQPSWKLSWLKEQPLRRLRELYDIGTIK